MIPNRIFFIWFGKALPWTAALAVRSAWNVAKPEEILLYHSGLEPAGLVRELTEEIPALKLCPIEGSLFDDLGDGGVTRSLYAELPSPATKANLVRLALLYKIGGVYLDTDVIVVEEFAKLLALRGFCGVEPVALPQEIFKSINPFRWLFCGLQFAFREFCARMPSGYKIFRLGERYYSTAANNAILASEPGNEFFKQAFEAIQKMPPAEQRKRFRLGTHLLQKLTQNQSSPNMTVLPAEFFYPLGPEVSAHWFRKGTAKKLGDMLYADTKVVHWYNSVEKRFLKTKIDANWVELHPDTAFSELAKKGRIQGK